MQDQICIDKTTYDVTTGGNSRDLHGRRRLPDRVRRARPAQRHIERQPSRVARAPETVHVIESRGAWHQSRLMIFRPVLVRGGGCRLGIVEQPGQRVVVAEELELMEAIGSMMGRIREDVGAGIAGAAAQAAVIRG